MSAHVEVPASVPSGRRWWFPSAVGLLTVAGVIAVRSQAELERNTKDWLTFALVVLAFLLGLGWFFFLARVARRVRLITLAVLAGGGLILWQTVRIVGTSSSIGFPRLAWRWTREPTRALSPGVEPTGPVSPASEIPDVPQFFGPNRDGVVNGSKLGRDWTAGAPRECWRRPIGAAWSSFAVAGGRAYTQEQRGEVEAVTCYDVLTGSLRWTHVDRARFSQWQGGEGPRATPTIDRGWVFSYGATGILNCLEAGTGRRRWSRAVLTENSLENLEWGLSASPLVVDDAVIVTGGNNAGPTLLASHRATGEPLWRSGKSRASYSSPLLATLAGRRVILLLTAAGLAAHDPATGEQILDHAWGSVRTPKAAQPVVLAGDRVFLSAGYGAGCSLVQIKAVGNRLEATEVWKTMRMKNQFNTVAAREGFLFGLDDGALACVEVTSGERRWKEGRFGSGQTLLVDDLVLIQMETGPVVLGEVTPDGFRELGRLPALSSKTWNYPTLAGRFLLVRNDQEAVCYELPAGR